MAAGPAEHPGEHLAGGLRRQTQASGQRAGLVRAEIGHLHALTDVERRALGVVDEIAGGGDADEHERQAARKPARGRGRRSRRGSRRRNRRRKAELSVVSISSTNTTTGASISPEHHFLEKEGEALGGAERRPRAATTRTGRWRGPVGRRFRRACRSTSRPRSPACRWRSGRSVPRGCLRRPGARRCGSSGWTCPTAGARARRQRCPRDRAQGGHRRPGAGCRRPGWPEPPRPRCRSCRPAARCRARAPRFPGQPCRCSLKYSAYSG